MKLDDIQYMRFNITFVKKQFEELFDLFSTSNNFEETNRVFLDINTLRDEIETTMNLVRIRFSQNTKDEFYSKENNYIDEVSPIYDGIVHEYFQLLVKSEFKEELIIEHGQQLMTLAELQLKTFSQDIIPNLMIENQLCSAYQKLSGSAEFDYNNKTLSMSQMGTYLSDDNRDVRLESRRLVMGFYEKNESEYDRIYDELVKIRTEIAHQLGYENYTQLGYDRYARSDYDHTMVAKFRDAVHEHIVPVAEKLALRQQNRLGLDKLSFIDEPLLFKTGNAKPKGNPEWIISQGDKVFSALGNETSECYKKMNEQGLLDLVARQGKSGGGYCEYLNTHQMPFIFSNFNGTSGDIDILTHEFGHAFQVYQTREFAVTDYHWATSEACEVHSTAMEYITWPSMNLFFNEDADKYRFTHLSTSIGFIPYIVTVDEFQYFVYENPNVSPTERKQKWREIEKKYMPHKDYEDFDFYSRGGTFFRQSHIFTIPFYYIEYALAKVCAYQFWRDSRADFDSTWNRYMDLCQLGGKYSFLELLRRSGIESPFEKDTLKNLMPEIIGYFNQVDDSKM